MALDPHTLSHVLTELADWQTEEGRQIDRRDVEEQLRDAGYDVEDVLDQVWGAFHAGQREEDPIEELAAAADAVADLLLEAIEDPSVEPYASALERLNEATARLTAY
jgi:hypothetical protein